MSRERAECLFFPPNIFIEKIQYNTFNHRNTIYIYMYIVIYTHIKTKITKKQNKNTVKNVEENN